jgi:hypothetical protein
MKNWQTEPVFEKRLLDGNLLSFLKVTFKINFWIKLQRGCGIDLNVSLNKFLGMKPII